MTERTESNPGAIDIKVNEPPRAVADTAVTDENVPVTIDVLNNDYDPDGVDLETVSVTGNSAAEITISSKKT